LDYAGDCLYLHSRLFSLYILYYNSISKTHHTLLYNKRNATPRKNRLWLIAGISCPSKAVFYFCVVAIADFAVWSEPIFQNEKPIFTICWGLTFCLQKVCIYPNLHVKYKSV
jgi:hypothetical protein